MKNASSAIALLMLSLASAHAQAPPTTFQSPPLQATSPLVGCIPVYQPLSTPPWRKLCNTDNFATAFGYITKPNYYTTADREAGAPNNPTGTASATCVMEGLSTGSGVNPTLLTPLKTGNYVLDIVGEGQSNAATGGATIQVYYGSGTPPVQGASPVGTPVGQPQAFLNNAASNRHPFHTKTYVAGLHSVYDLLGGYLSRRDCHRNGLDICYSDRGNREVIGAPVRQDQDRGEDAHGTVTPE